VSKPDNNSHNEIEGVLEERLRLMLLNQYGAVGEKLSQLQMQLFELAPVVSETIRAGRDRGAPAHRSTKEIRQASGSPGVARTSATRADSALHAGSARANAPAKKP